MKTTTTILLLLLAASVSTHGAIYDDFSATQLDTSRWVSNIPYSDSVQSLENGYLKLRNGGGIITATGQGTYADITGRFSYAGSSYDQFGILLRADQTLRFGSYGTFSAGIYVEFNLRSGDQGSFSNNIEINDYLENRLWTATYPLDVGSQFDFRVLDTGNQISVFLGDLTNPLLTGSTTFRIGDQIAFQNREGAGNGSFISAGGETRIYDLSITAVPVPEPSTIAFGAFLVFSASIHRRRFNCIPNNV